MIIIAIEYFNQKRRKMNTRREFIANSAKFGALALMGMA